MNYAEYKKLKDQIEEDYKKKIDALEMIWRMSNGQNGDSSTVVSGKGSGPLSDAIRQVINGLEDTFTADDIEQGLRAHNIGKEVKRLSITNTLHRLCRRSEIELVKKGQGRIPGVYRNKPNKRLPIP